METVAERYPDLFLDTRWLPPPGPRQSAAYRSYQPSRKASKGAPEEVEHQPGRCCLLVDVDLLDVDGLAIIARGIGTMVSVPPDVHADPPPPTQR